MGRIPILYIAPWVDYGGTDKGTIDWFRLIDRTRFAPSLILTQPSPNRRLAEVEPYANEVWALPDLMPAERMPKFIFDFVHSREIQVVHVMNSRLGFDLLPDLNCLPRPPKVVVQLHVEEADRSGYVKYVTTRYGNLVDRFSVTSEHLAAAVHDYGVAASSIEVIYTGVDAEREFVPEQATPIPDLPSDRLNLLYPGRLVEQKDPLLMVEISAALRDRGVPFALHVVGEGDLEPEVRGRVTALGLEGEVRFHPPTPDLQRWYAACDALLMTSVFEGVPYVVFEAMAMAMPVVAPALPGNVELLGRDDAGLVEPRDAVDAYVAALERLASDIPYRHAHGSALRARVRDRFSLERMASEHGELYEALADRCASDEPPEPPIAATPPIRFDERPLFGTPLVSVVVPHFNQTRFLEECIRSVRGQSYPAIEIVLVDDASTEGDAAEILDALERDGATVVRLSENGGPSHARNVGIARSRGRYVLPVDADNELLPDAVERLVEQLSEANEDVGFVYPNLQHFGNRQDYFEAPAFDVYKLTQFNYCDTCSLFDRKVFDEGLLYSEAIRLGHEDWEFVLRLAARGIRGEPARVPTLRYRKWGFNRSDAVEHAPDRFHELMAEISPFEGHEAALKAAESPALSFIVPRPVEDHAARDLAAAINGQSCSDFELIAPFDAPRTAAADPAVRRLPVALAATPLEAIRHARSVARGQFLAATSAPAAALFGERTLVEKLLRRFLLDDDLDAIALIDAGADGRFPLRALSPADGDPGARAHTVIWRARAEEALAHGLHVDTGDPVASIATVLSGGGVRVEWRHLPTAAGSAPPEPAAEWAGLAPLAREAPHSGGPGSRALLPPPPLVPKVPKPVPRWKLTPTWTPPQAALVCRHRELGGERRIVTNDRKSPDGFEAEWDLGALRMFAFEGTARIVRTGDDYLSLPRDDHDAAPPDAVDLGYVELAPFPLLDTLALAIHRKTGQRTLVALPGDPILDDVDLIETLGFIEPFPLRPREVPAADRHVGLVGLTKAVDAKDRRHRYAVGRTAEGQHAAELGALADSPLTGATAVRIADGRLSTDEHEPPVSKPSLKAAVRWSGAPVRWSDVTGLAPRGKAVARRSLVATTQLVSKPARPDPSSSKPVGWLYGDERPGRAPLYASYHPVTGDQLLSRARAEGPGLGYGPPELLGYVRLVAPITGSLDQRAVALPWASRFGKAARR